MKESGGVCVCVVRVCGVEGEGGIAQLRERKKQEEKQKKKTPTSLQIPQRHSTV